MDKALEKAVEAMGIKVQPYGEIGDPNKGEGLQIGNNFLSYAEGRERYEGQLYTNVSTYTGGMSQDELKAAKTRT